MNRIPVYVILVISAFYFVTCSSTVTRVACVGDSITYGFGPTDNESYPEVVQRLVGTDMNVINFGVSGTTMMKTGDYPYWSTNEYLEALAFLPNIVVIQLGTNDAKTYQWDQDEYTTDYNSMIAKFASLSSSPTIYVSIPPPLYIDNVYSMNQTVINTVLPSLLHGLAADNGCPYVDVFDHMGTVQLTHSDWFSDGCHPNADGYEILGEIVYAAIRTW